MEGRYKSYPEYKDSGVEWLGNIPSSWKFSRLKFLAKIKNGQDYKNIEVENGYPVIGSGGQFTYASDFLYDKESVLLGRKGTIDKPLYINEPFWTVDTMYYTVVGTDVPVKYLYYLALTIQFNKYTTNTALPSMTQENLGNYMFSIPNDEIEKQSIVNFLDHETAKIDILIEKQQHLIKLLKEKRQAVISHAVTKGLNPDAPMKDSGMEWLGEVPEHWEVGIKLNSFAERSKGSFVNGPFGSDLLSNELTDEGVPVIYIRDLKQTGYKRKSRVCVIAEKAEQLEVCKVKSGDVLIAKVGDPPGETCVYPKIEPDAIITQDVIRIRVDNVIVNSDYLSMLLNSDFGKLVIDDVSVEATRKRVSLGDFKSTRFILPPLVEQNKIIEFLLIQIKIIDQLILKVEEAISLTRERRTALISAAVTGKIDVRNFTK